MGGYKDNEKPHRELKPEPFLMSRYEITVGQFREFIEHEKYETDAEKRRFCYINGHLLKGKDITFLKGLLSFFGVEKSLVAKSDLYWDNPGFKQTDEHPVVCVSWNDAQAYLKWLSSKTYRDYRLPSEAEWEYATRATSDANYSWGDSLPECDTNAKNGANFDDDDQCGDLGTKEVGSYQENKLGLHDMHGNVSELVQDCKDRYKTKHTTAMAVELKDCRQRVVRGGSWSSHAEYLRSAKRSWLNHNSAGNYVGFRVVRDAFSTSSDQR